MIYNDRAQMDSFEATHFTQRINELCAQIEAQMAEDEPYAVLSDNNTVLRFYYDKQKSARGGMSVGPFTERRQQGWFSERNTITNVVFDESFANCTSLTSTAYWFADLINLTTITGISNLNTDNVTDMNSMFMFCRNLTSLDVSGFNTSNVTNMESMFYECSSLTSLDVSKFNTSKVTNMMAMFQFCSGLTILDVSKFDMSNVTSLMQMFCECSSLTSLKLGAFNIEKVTDIQGLFYGLSSMHELDLSSINTSNIEGMAMLFQSCTSLTTLNLSNFNTARVTNMLQMFYGCTNLKTIFIGDDWTTSAVTNSENMFLDCTSLVGGAGTPYDSTHVDYTYAHIDGGENNPGYFTDKNAPEGEATFDGLVARVSGERTLDEAFEQRGGRTEAAKTIAAIVWNKETALTNTDLQGITNPNLLIYVKADSLAPTNRNNIIVDGFAKNIVLTDLAQGNNNFYCPQNFTAEAISYTHEFNQQTQIGVSRGWETIALPFTVQIIMHEARGLITPFGNSSSNTHFWLRRLTSNGLQAVPMLEANTAYLISMPNSEEYSAEFNLAGRVTFSAENAVVPMTEIVKDESADYVMIPVFENTAAKQGVYVLNVGEERNGYPEGSIFESNYRAVLPFQAYTEHKGSNPAPAYIIVGDLGGDTTGIDAILVNSERVKSEAWYTLDGRKLQEKPTQKGVYISNGKKVIIK
jgi:surface protein